MKIFQTKKKKVLFQLLQQKNSKHKPSLRIETYKDSIWSEFTPLAMKTNSVNLGQGFPDWQPPEFMKKMGSYSINEESNQYTRAMGALPLVQEIAKFYTYKNDFQRKLNPLTEILVTNGASGAFNCALQSIINPGDEVILIEPFYDIYPAQIHQAGGKPIYVPLIDSKTFDSNDWKIDFEKLNQVMSSKTKAIILNNPHNPTGKCFKTEELEKLSQFIVKNDLICLTDEVYESFNFSETKHQRIANYPGMFDRTLTICSAGKTFSVTGWKIGWIIGPEDLVFNAYLVNQYTVFCVSTPLQLATAHALELTSTSNYFEELRSNLRTKKEQLCEMLDDVSLKPVIPHSGYFVLVDISKIDFPWNESKESKDYAFCRWLPHSIGIAAIPLSPFYSNFNVKLAENYARFCFAKNDETMSEAKKRIIKLKQYLK
eukprot:gene2842-4248_t